MKNSFYRTQRIEEKEIYIVRQTYLHTNLTHHKKTEKYIANKYLSRWIKRNNPLSCVVAGHIVTCPFCSRILELVAAE